VKFLDAVYENAFQLYWTQTLGKAWSPEVAANYARAMDLPADPSQDNLAQSARRAFLNAPISCGIDILFGGGVYEFESQALKGQFHPSRIQHTHPEWFTEASFPSKWAGSTLRDPEGLWYGTAFSGFGMVYNRDVLEALNYPGLPQDWDDLGDSRFFGEIALSDPTKSGATKQGFALVIQEEMLRALKELSNQNVPVATAEPEAIRRGWTRGLCVLQRMAANARYFTEKSIKPILDVSSGNCALGMATDFAGLSQEQNLMERSSSTRFGYISPKVGSTVLPDPIGIMKGTTHPTVAEAFMEYVIGLEGQKLWAFKAGTPGGPTQYTLRRLPIRRELYDNAEFQAYRSDPELNPYIPIPEFAYRPEWTAPIIGVLQIVIRTAFMDPHHELQDAWEAIIRARSEGRQDDAKKALAVLEDFSGLDYDAVSMDFATTYRNGTPLDRILLESKLTNRFIEQYRLARQIAQGEASN
ncbi:MAG: hypothetical protein B7X06_00445, partial [Verrucomicrobia bacterium 21-51-4]